jgi:hypothetical protein
MENAAYTPFHKVVREFLFNTLPVDEATALWRAGQRIEEIPMRNTFYSNLLKDLSNIIKGEKESVSAVKNMGMYKWNPVSVQQFIEDPYYLNKADTIYPKVLEELIEMNSGKYVEIVHTGGIGSAKTTTALYTQAYQLYLLSCMRNPHETYQMDRSSEILIIFQSINAKLAKEMDFARFRAMIHESKYFKENFPFKKDIESKLVFPNRIEVVPVSGQETAAIGQNVIGGAIDELNYMAVVDKSKANVDGGTYDQAVSLYNSIARRRKSRFFTNGAMPGILSLVSSKRYPGQFTDTKEEEAKSDPTIYIYDKRVWDVKPEGTFTEDRFRVFIGDETRKPRVLMENEEIHPRDKHLVDYIPMDFRADFQKDIINALREIAGKSTLARFPFFTDLEKIVAASGKVQSIFTTGSVDFVSDQLGIITDNFWNKEIPRFAHVDLAISSDSAGIVIGTVSGFDHVKRGDDDAVEILPRIRIDGILEVRPPRGGEIQFHKIRKIFYTLRELGLNIKWITFDSFQSTDSMQMLRQQGFLTGYESMDTHNTPYDFLKTAFYDGRVDMEHHPRLIKELASLEKVPKTGKIDHPPLGSKDLGDALAGVVFGLTMRREMWAQYKIPVMMIPSSVTQAKAKEERMKNSLDNREKVVEASQ